MEQLLKRTTEDRKSRTSCQSNLPVRPTAPQKHTRRFAVGVRLEDLLSLNEANNNHDENNDQQEVNETADVENDKSEQPQDKEDNGDGPKHDRLLMFLCT